jgi:hypothetical protein
MAATCGYLCTLFSLMQGVRLAPALTVVLIMGFVAPAQAVQRY